MRSPGTSSASASTVAHGYSPFSYSDAALQTGVHTTLYLPSPPPERNPIHQVAPREDGPMSSLAGDLAGDRAPGGEHAFSERLPGACSRCKRLKVRATFSILFVRKHSETAHRALSIIDEVHVYCAIGHLYQVSKRPSRVHSRRSQASDARVSQPYRPHLVWLSSSDPQAT